MTEVKTSTCRACSAYCPIEVTIRDGRVVKVDGNHAAPLYGGFICPKGRALTAMHNDPNRLTHCLKRRPDGSYTPIGSTQAIEEISDKLSEIIAVHGPRAVAGFTGGPSVEQPASAPLMLAFLRAIGSPMVFSAATIDQPGLMIANALHGTWAGGRMRPEFWDVFVMIGGNPIISKQYFGQNPGSQLKSFVGRGARLIVIDPRRTETARKAHVHLQCIPGEDPTILAGLIHLIIANDWVDREFVEHNTQGFDQLARAVSRFTPDYVAERAGIGKEDLHEAARIIGQARTGDLGSGTGPSMATRGSLTAYLMLCLQTLRGFWAAAGDEAVQPRVLLPRARFKAQPRAPYPAWGFGEKLRARGLQQSVAGLPTGALCEEILTPGEGQIRALFLHGGAMLTWPQQELTKRALQSLDLLVMHDIEVSPTAQMAHYVIATKLEFEVPAISLVGEISSMLHPGYGWSDPYAAYHPALLDPPEGSDVLDAWQIYYRMAQKFGLQLKFGSGKPPFDMEDEPSTDDIYEYLCMGSAVALSEVKKYPHGHIFDEAREIVGPRDPDCAARLDLANAAMLDELATVRAENVAERRKTNEDFPFLLIPRRMQNVTNAAYRPPGLLRKPYNPAFMNSADMRRLGINSGDFVEISSRHGMITAIVEADSGLRAGVVSLSHGFGGTAGEPPEPRKDGANVNCLTRMDDDYDPYTGIPRMGALPVSVSPSSRCATACPAIPASESA
jgi:anaerobic selenocysteine-containing dehydrogenase